MPYKDPEMRRLKQKQYNKNWRNKHPDFAEMRKEYPSYKTNYGRATNEAAAAHEAVKRAVAKGLLVRPSTCERCGLEGRIEASHKDYIQQLEVEWLCTSCHRQEDADNPKNGRTIAPRTGRLRSQDIEQKGIGRLRHN